MLTIVVSNNHSSDSLYYTLLSLRRSAADIEMKIFVLGTKGIEFERDAFSDLDIVYLDNAEPRAMSDYVSVLDKVENGYILFTDSGSLFADDFGKAISYLVEGTLERPEEDRKNIVALGYSNISYEKVPELAYKGFKALDTEATRTVRLDFTPTATLTETIGVLFRVKELKRVGIDVECKLDGLKLAMAQLMSENDAFLRTGKRVMRSSFPTTTNSVKFAGKLQPEWYFNSLERYVLPMLQTLTKENGKPKDFVQYLALYELIYRYLYNQNSNDKHIVDADFDRFRDLCSAILNKMDNRIIFNFRSSPGYRFPAGMHHALLQTKYGGQIDSSYVYDNKNNILRVYDDIVMARARNLKVILELMEYEDGVLTVEGSIDDFLDMRNVRLQCLLNKEEIELTETYRYAHTKFFGVSTNKRYTFRFTIRDDELLEDEPNRIHFYLCHGDVRVLIPMVTRRYTSKISSSVKFSYWMYGNDRRAVYFTRNNRTLTISKMDKMQRFKREFKLCKHMLTGRVHTPGMCLTRILYWLTHPFFKKKRIWITYDKLYKGGDCGEYFYKYMNTRAKEDGITPVYVINKDSQDLKRLHKEGYRPVKFGTMKNRLYYLNAEAVFATHGGVHSFNSISKSRIKYVADLLHAEVTCIQHGLSVQQLAQELNRIHNNTKRYYCASKYEIQNLAKPIYGYEDKSALRLTGVPRYDGLKSNDQKQILITPTWRAYISMPPVMGKSRPYYPEFKNTDYYKFYYNLLTDERLIQTARRTGYKLIYLLHPIISSQIVDYPEIDGVEIIPATSVNYEKILTESSLMLTDYSGVQFDFAYMRKPVVYYHPPELPPHYKEGGFFYDTMGFGEICTKHDEMVKCLCEYMENGCQMKPFYKDRADDFFAFDDFNSCQRIYDDFKEYIGKKREKALIAQEAEKEAGKNHEPGVVYDDSEDDDDYDE